MNAIDGEKIRIESIFMSERDRYFEAVLKEIESQPDIFVEVSKHKIKGYCQPVFVDDKQRKAKLPEEAGVYLVYRKTEQLPFYCGEADKLCNRVSFHFKDSVTARNTSTLKKKLPEHERGLGSMSDRLKIRYTTIPFGRKDVEEYLHRTYKINTKKVREPKCSTARSQ